MSRQEKNMKTCWLFTRKELVGNEVQRKLVFCLISGQSPRCEVRTRGGQGGVGSGGWRRVCADRNSLMLQTSHPQFQKLGFPSLFPSLSAPESHIPPRSSQLNFPISSPCVPLSRSVSQAHGEPGAFSTPTHHLPPSHNLPGWLARSTGNEPPICSRPPTSQTLPLTCDCKLFYFTYI